MATFNVVFEESTDNQTTLLRFPAVLRKGGSSSSHSEHAQTNAILILIGIVGVCLAALMIVSYQLWKARRTLR